MKDLTLGILGGLGPMSSVYFYELLTAHTKAERDQEHINILLSSRADTPDRTDFILGRSQSDPIYTMISEVNKLIGAGAEIIAIPCNTAHHFYEKISCQASVPVINIIKQTARFCRYLGVKKVGVLATEGTTASGAYKNILSAMGIEYVTCENEEQEIITDIIYEKIKKGEPANIGLFLRVVDKLKALGCEKIILGCTELSLLKRNYKLGSDFIDSMEVLAASAIKLCGKETIGFDTELESFTPTI